MLMGVAFYTLVERRVLGGFHIRYGPSRVGMQGIFQPFRDAMKLFFKRIMFMRRVDWFFWNISPILRLFLFLLGLSLVWFGGGMFSFFHGGLFFFCVVRARIYFLVWGGFFSGRKYSVLGAYRAVSQIISYEVILMFLFLGVCLVSSGFRLMKISEIGRVIFLGCPVMFVIWMISCLAENNRLPFDFLEGESELVSGFNTEYWGGYFSFIFIFEYGYMIIFRFITSLMFFSPYFRWLFIMIILYFYLWVRATFPRSRYDFLIIISWKKLLVIRMGVLVYLMVIC